MDIDAASTIAWRGPWNAALAYAAGDAVSYQGSAYIAFLPTTAGIEPTDTKHWQTLVEKGAAGLTWNGAWRAGPYVPGSAVGHAGSSWISAKSMTADDVPGTAAAWELLAAKGGLSGGIVWKGDWSDQTTYKANDTVKSTNKVYVAIVDPPKGTVPTDTKYWALFSDAGNADAIAIVSVVAAAISAAAAVGSPVFSTFIGALGVLVNLLLSTSTGAAAATSGVVGALATSAGAGAVAGAIGGTSGGLIATAIADAIRQNPDLGRAVADQVKNSPEFKQAQTDITNAKTDIANAQKSATDALTQAQDAGKLATTAKDAAASAQQAATTAQQAAATAQTVATKAENVAQTALKGTGDVNAFLVTMQEQIRNLNAIVDKLPKP